MIVHAAPLLHQKLVDSSIYKVAGPHAHACPCETATLERAKPVSSVACPPWQRVTKNHVTVKCYGLGLGLDTFRMVAIDANFRKMEESQVAATYSR